MKYTTQTLDRRHKYHDRFRYYVKFGATMNGHLGALNFNYALQWMIQTWGWSAEIQQYTQITKWAKLKHMLQSTSLELPPECNPHWSWTNQFDDLRIYLLSEAELSFFQLAHPVDQK